MLLLSILSIIVGCESDHIPANLATYERSKRMSSLTAETICNVWSLVPFYAARDDSCVSMRNERLDNENVCVPLNEGHHKDLAEFKSHVMPFTDIKRAKQKRI